MIIEEPIIVDPQGPKSVTMFTTIAIDRVVYEIVVVEMPTNDKKTVWAKEVFFGNKGFNRPGGPAFQLAAREQYKRAWGLTK
jgi:hypothetical protein